MGSGYSIRAKANAEAEIYIYEDVGQGWFGGVSAKQFADDLKALGKVEIIHLRLNSYGGDVFDGLAIYRLLMENSAKIISHVDGIAASIASIIAMAGEEIHIAESGQMMIHDAWGFAMGPADEMRRMADQLEATTGSLADVYVKRTDNALDKVRAWMTAETWFIGQQAIDAGFADSLAENMRLAAHADAGKHKFRNMPAPPAMLTPARIIAPAASVGDAPKRDAAAARIAAMSARMTLRDAGAKTAAIAGLGK